MDRLLPALIVAAILALALGLMWLGWRSRQRRQRSLPQLSPVPADAGAELLRVTGFYVATTVAEEPLERIAVGGLGYRAKAQLAVRERGLELEIPGQNGLFVPAADVTEVFRARNTIDRVVERDGLVVVRYRIASDGPAVDSYVRIVDPAAANEFVAVLSSLSAKAGTP